MAAQHADSRKSPEANDGGTIGEDRMSYHCAMASFALASIAPALFAGSPVELVGVGRVSGVASDMSGQSTVLENGEPHDRFGGISALEYTGQDDRYFALSDRGPDDGATGYLCRFHHIDVRVDAKADMPVDVRIVASTMLSDSEGRPFSGMSTAYSATTSCAGRLDPEGCRCGPNGDVFVSDEYGPALIQFSRGGCELNRLPLPEHLFVKHPGPSKKQENAQNDTGRASNKGMEGLAISQNGRVLTGAMQSVLLQDGLRDGRGKPVGTHCRLVQIDRFTNRVSEFVYQLDAPDNGLNEVLACEDGQFLVIERDGMSGTNARFKKIMKISTANATDVSQYDRLPPTTLPSDIKPVAKTEFINFLDPQFGLTAEQLPEKLEGLTWGPALDDGRRTLLVASDNDFEQQAPSLIYVFAVELH